MTAHRVTDATVSLDTERHVGEVDRRVFGGFLEHLGRAVYGGVFDPGNPRSDADGFRTDVLDALRRLRMPAVRYPGGNFASNYDWRDGVGPVEERPARPDYAWQSIESNTFGTDEFVTWCRALGTDPWLVVNLGTLGAREAAAWVEYCNMPGGTAWSDRRVANGYVAPHGVKLWGLGNEMDGAWQAGHVAADLYARRADQAAKLMRALDPEIQLIACGSTSRTMPTYMAWDQTVLDVCWDSIDYLAAHDYARNAADTAAFLAYGTVIDEVLDDYAALLRYMRARKGDRKAIGIAFDEWNVWPAREMRKGEWAQGPALLEQHYSLADALVVAQYLMSLIRHADVVKIGGLAQIVNVIAPVMARADGVLLQATYHPLRMISEATRGRSLVPLLKAPDYLAGELGAAPVVDVAATHDPAGDTVALFAVNRSMDMDVTLRINLTDRQVRGDPRVETLSGPDPTAANTWDQPDAVRPSLGHGAALDDGQASIRVPRLGVAVARMHLQAR